MSVRTISAVILLLLFILTPGCSFLGKNASQPPDPLKLGKEAFKKEDYPKAVGHFSAHIKQNPRSFEAYLLRGEAEIKAGMYNEALIDAGRAHNLKQKHPAPLLLRAQALAGQNKHVKAIDIYTDLIKSEPRNPRYYFDRGNLYAEIWKFNHALVDYERSLKLNPKHSETYLNRGIVYKKMGKTKQAIRDFSLAIKHQANDENLSPVTFAYYNRGNAYFRSGDVGKARDDWGKVIEMAPKSVEGRMAQAQLNKQQTKSGPSRTRQIE